MIRISKQTICMVIILLAIYLLVCRNYDKELDEETTDMEEIVENYSEVCTKNCNLSLSKCKECDNCGLCTDKDNNIKCVPGNDKGPSGDVECNEWTYEHKKESAPFYTYYVTYPWWHWRKYWRPRRYWRRHSYNYPRYRGATWRHIKRDMRRNRRKNKD